MNRFRRATSEASYAAVETRGASGASERLRSVNRAVRRVADLVNRDAAGTGRVGCGNSVGRYSTLRRCPIANIAGSGRLRIGVLMEGRWPNGLISRASLLHDDRWSHRCDGQSEDLAIAL